MRGFIILILLLGFKVYVFAQANNDSITKTEDYKVYSVIISLEIDSRSKSIAVINNTINPYTESSYISEYAEQLKSKDSSMLYQAYFLVESAKGKRNTIIDSAAAKCIIAYCNDTVKAKTLNNRFDLGKKVYLIDSFPQSSVRLNKNWKHFYKKYRYSAGIFQFSAVQYYLNNTLAIAYYSRHQQSLSAHGTIAILERREGTWAIKYRIQLWQS